MYRDIPLPPKDLKKCLVKFQEDEKKWQNLLKQLELTLKTHEQLLNKHEKLIKGTQVMKKNI